MTDFTVVGAAVEPRPTRTAPLPASEALFTSGCEPYCRHITPQAHFPEDKGFVKVASRLCGQGLAGDLPGGTLPGPAPHRTPGSPRRAGAPPSCASTPSFPAGVEEGLASGGRWPGRPPGRAARERGARHPPQGGLGIAGA